MSSSVDQHSVPPFYACYLLRSYATASSARTYIGSTPDPVRRKKQHNGVLSQGAHKTQRGRPWETQMLVFGFPSKIAALQFEWAWQKPYLSRHLRTHPIDSSSGTAESSTAAAAASSQSNAHAHVALPLFTDTPLNQIARTDDGCRPLPGNSVQTSLLVARALLRSEPFAGWGLRIVFFEEYLWSAWVRLQDRLPNLTNKVDCARAGLNVTSYQTRLGRPLPPMNVSPNVICDFNGVDATRKSMLTFSEDERKAAKLDSSSKGKAKGKAVMEGKPPGTWPETLPKTLTVRAMGGTWASLEQAPSPNITLVNREKGKTSLRDGAEGSHTTDARASRMHLDDEDLASLVFTRFMQAIDKLSIDDVRPFDKGEGAVRGQLSDGPVKACAICERSVRLRDHLTYSTCPSPFKELTPLAMSSSSTPSAKSSGLARFGFRAEVESASSMEKCQVRSCKSVFHTSCLAKSFLTQNGQVGRFLLPTHGCCPICVSNGKEECRMADSKQVTCWNEVIRGVFRRRDLVERHIKDLEVTRMKAARVAVQEAKKATKKRVGVGKKRSKKQPVREGEDDEEEEPELGSRPSTERNSSTDTSDGAPKSRGLLDVLDDMSLLPTSASGNENSAAAAAAKRSVPSAWTPQPARTAPQDRTNTILGRENDVALSPTRPKVQQSLNIAPLLGKSNTVAVSRPRPRPMSKAAPTFDVIDLT